MDNIDNLIREFSSSVDKGLELQKDINEFARQISGNLVNDINGEGVLATFNNNHLSIKVFANTNLYGQVVYSVKLLDFDKWARATRLSVPETIRVKCFNFEHDKDNQLQDEIRSVLVLALFDFYGIEFSAEDLGEEETVRLSN